MPSDIVIRRTAAAAVVAPVFVWLFAATLHSTDSTVGAGSRLLLAPIGATVDRVESVADSFREALGLQVDVLPSIDFSRASYDFDRSQFVAERLIRQLREHYGRMVAGSRVVLVGITGADMYESDYPRWQFVFSYRDEASVAIVSYARMDPRVFGEPADEDRLQSRLRKMVAKDVGVLMYGLPTTSDPRSLLFNGILGLEELDRIEEDFARAGMMPIRRP